MPVDTLTKSVAGEWGFAADPDDQGISEEWFRRSLTNEHVALPGSMTENGKGNDVTLDTPWTGRIRDTSFFDDDRYAKYREPGNIKLPFWLTPLKHYMGVAWYQREIEIPAEWDGKFVRLRLERPHWSTQVWFDDHPAGEKVSLSTAHVHPLGILRAGKHTLTVRVDNRLYVDVGEDAHSVTDHSQTNWNGVVGTLELIATEPVWLGNVQVWASSTAEPIRVAAALCNQTAHTADCMVDVEIRAVGSDDLLHETKGLPLSVPPGTHKKAFEIEAVPDLREWSPFNPSLYDVRLTLRADGNELHHVSTVFGIRKIETTGNRILLNEKPIFLRGTLECCVFPKTGYPPTDKPAWTRILRIIKAHGLNHMRFHSWCPPEAAFQAADEEGIILSVECASWATVGFDEKYEQWLYGEADAILREYGNHPSFCMMLYGNEPYGFRASTFLADFVSRYRKEDSRRLYSSGTAWPLIPENQFQVWANPRIQYWDQNLESRINAQPPETTFDYSDYLSQYPQPVISHEVGQWCVYPNFDEIPKYDGALRAYSFEIFRDFLEQAGLADQAKDFLMASGRLQVLCYKEEIESALRTPGMAGFQLLDLHDFPGQGTALVGVLDAFWDEKGYVTPEEFRRFCGPVVPLARLEKRVFTNNEDFCAELMVSQFGAGDLPDGRLIWRLLNDGVVVYTGSRSINKLSAGKLHNIEEVSQGLADITKATKLTFEVELPEKSAVNDWDIWVYPEKADTTPGQDIHIASRLDAGTREVLRGGGKVLLMPDVEQVRGDENGQVPPGFSSIFWNTAWTQGQQPHTLGILCDPGHPALAHFPTEFHSNWQWWYIINRSRSMILNALPNEVKPIVQVIDDWFKARRLGLVFECVMDGGKLLVSSIDVKDGAPDDPVRRQMLHSLLRYMDSEDFAPTVPVTAEQLKKVVESEKVRK